MDSTEEIIAEWGFIFLVFESLYFFLGQGDS